MKITIDVIPVSSICEFAEQHGLELEVKERKVEVGSENRYYACFVRTEVKDGGLLRGEFGNGSTPEEAIDNYAKEIEIKTIVVNAYSDTERKEIEVPRLFKEKENQNG